MERILNRVNQTQLAEEFGVTKKTINRILWKASRNSSTHLLISNAIDPLQLKREWLPLLIFFVIGQSHFRAKAEEVAKSLGETNFKAVGESQEAKPLIILVP